MKASVFNRIFQAQDGAWLAFNGWSTALAEIDPQDLSFIRAMLADPDSVPCDSPHKREIREALITGHFLVEDGENELALLQSDMFRDRFRSDQLMLTIAPTLDCNFRCDYCYEERLRVTMSRPVQEKVLAFVTERAPRLTVLHVTWFGGEPTLPAAFKVVESLSHGFLALAEQHGLEYGGQLVTNGFLFDRPLAERAAALKITSVQFTIDGPQPVHDQRRVLASGAGTFDRILRNLEATADLVQLQLRINVDRRNAAAALDVIELLERRGLIGKVRPYLAQVTSSGAACGNIQESCYSHEEFAQTEIELYREAARRGLPLLRYPFRIDGGFCTADRSHAFVFAPSGAVFKCWHEVTSHADRAVDHLLDGEQPFHVHNEARWLAWNPLEKSDCRSCDVLPMCHGGCPYEALRRAHPTRGACEPYKHHLEPLLELRYLRGGKPGDGESPARGGAAPACS